MNKTTISITTEVRDKLVNLGSKTDSYDDILRKLLSRTQVVQK